MTATLDRPAPPATAARPVLTISRPVLRAALPKLMTVAASARSLAVFQHILFEARDNVLTLTATNIDTFVRLTLPCEFTGTATVLLPAKMLADIVASLAAAGALSLTFTGQGAEVTAGRSRFEINGLAPSEFPELPAVESRERTTVKAGPFLDALSRCAAHTSHAESRPILNAVLVEQEAGQVAIVGCEGSSLARLPAGMEGDFTAPCLIHRLAVPVLARLFAGLDADASLAISSDANRLRVDSADASVQVRLIEGPYPAYRQLIKQTPTHVLVCDRALFAAALKRVSIAADQNGRVSIDIDDEIVIRAVHADIGAANDVVPIEEHRRDAGRTISFDVNAELLATALTTIATERVEFSIEAPERALQLRKVDQAESDPTLLLVMPLRRL